MNLKASLLTTVLCCCGTNNLISSTVMSDLRINIRSFVDRLGDVNAKNSGYTINGHLLQKRYEALRLMLQIGECKAQIKEIDSSKNSETESIFMKAAKIFGYNEKGDLNWTINNINKLKKKLLSAQEELRGLRLQKTSKYSIKDNLNVMALQFSRYAEFREECYLFIILILIVMLFIHSR